MVIYRMEHALPVSRELVERVLAVFSVTVEQVAGLQISQQRINRAFTQNMYSRRKTDYQFYD
jgi:hypothetical protein